MPQRLGQPTRTAVRLVVVPTAHQLSPSGSHLPLLATATGLLGGRGLGAQWTFLPFRQPIQAQPGASSCFLLTTTATGNPASIPNPTVSES